jgi:Putative amidoligase enzyme
MNTQEILSQQQTKTWKIEQLILTGLTRTEIAQLVTNGNYGFVQNVYAKMKAQGRLNLTAEQNFQPTFFNRQFGVEIEAYGIEKGKLAELIRNAGVECHAEGYNHTTRRHWKIVTDGSLDGINTFEIVSPILEGTLGIEELQKVCEVLETARVKINKSCGLHIHFDAHGFGLQQVKNMLFNYAAFENEIDSFMPNSRRANNNTYCKSVIGYETRVERASNMQQLAGVFSSRYFKVNLQSYSRHNTIEFRQHSGTVEFKKISNWIMFLHNLTEYSKTKRVSQSEANFEGLKKINQTEIINYIVTRQNQLAA